MCVCVESRVIMELLNSSNADKVPANGLDLTNSVSVSLYVHGLLPAQRQCSLRQRGSWLLLLFKV